MGLKEFLLDKFGNAPASIINNKIIRFTHKRSKTGSKSCWVKNLGNIAFCGSWATDEFFIWKSEQHNKYFNSMSSFQKRAHLDALQKQNNEIQQKEIAEKLTYIREEWRSYNQVAINNDYFKRKQCDVMVDMKMLDNDVLIPMYNNLKSTEICGVHQIFNNSVDNKTKIFMWKSCPNGAFYIIKQGDYKLMHSDVFYIVEGYANGYSLMKLLNEYSDTMLASIFVAFSAYNIKNVVVKIRELFLTKQIIILADNDQAGIAGAKQGVCMGANAYINFNSETQDINDLYIADKDKCLKEFKELINTLK